MIAAVRTSIDEAVTALACVDSLEERQTARLLLALAALDEYARVAGPQLCSGRERAAGFERALSIVGRMWSEESRTVST